eukprot:1159089-Pelagomonas_calceolata.AAC.4
MKKNCMNDRIEPAQCEIIGLMLAKDPNRKRLLSHIHDTVLQETATVEAAYIRLLSPVHATAP